MKLSILFVIYFITACRGQFISGSSPVSIDKYPFACALRHNSGTGTEFQYACGGSILTRTAVLSAASCFNGRNTPSTWQVRVNSSDANSGGTIHPIGRISVHPDFQITTKNNDIAVLRTTTPITLQSGFVELARIAVGNYQFETNQRVYAIGWGSANDETTRGQLHDAQLFKIDQDVCAVRYEDFDLIVTDNMVCFGWLDVGVRAQCSEGGYGSSVIAKDGVIVGVFSTSEGCAELRYPGINTRMSEYWRWIITESTLSLTARTSFDVSE